MTRITREQLLDILQTSESEEMLLDMADFDCEMGGNGSEFLDLYKQSKSEGVRNGEEKGNSSKN